MSEDLEPGISELPAQQSSARDHANMESLRSMAISLKRIADAQEGMAKAQETLAEWAAENWRMAR